MGRVSATADRTLAELPTVSITLEREHGRDPRAAPPWISENKELLDELSIASAKAPRASAASSTPAISPMSSLAEFEAALHRATKAGRLLIIKWYSAQCRACLSAKPLYEKTANGLAGDVADFYEVEGATARVLCALADIRKMPVVHIYKHGQLHDTRAIHSRPMYEEFAKGMQLHAMDFQT